jgi:hypothetical protein
MHWCDAISTAPTHDAVVQLNRKDYRILRIAINIVFVWPARRDMRFIVTSLQAGAEPDSAPRERHATCRMLKYLGN